jgi:hypothetical protein
MGSVRFWIRGAHFALFWCFNSPAGLRNSLRVDLLAESRSSCCFMGSSRFRFLLIVELVAEKWGALDFVYDD